MRLSAHGEAAPYLVDSDRRIDVKRGLMNGGAFIVYNSIQEISLKRLILS